VPIGYSHFDDAVKIGYVDAGLCIES